MANNRATNDHSRTDMSMSTTTMVTTMSEKEKEDALSDRLYGVISTWNQAISTKSQTPKRRRGGYTFERQIGMKRSRTRYGDEDDDEMEPSTCQPWSREMFHERVATFTVMRWFGKPDRIGPLRCARFGWICEDTDMIACRSCSVRRCFKLSDDLEDEARDKVVNEYAGMLKSGHEPLCPWNNNPSPTSFVTVPRIADTLRATYRKRLASMKGSTFRIVKDAYEEIERVVEREGAETILSTPQVVAIFGWTACPKIDEKRGLNVRCTICNRRYAAQASESDETREFHPITEHRWWCPWIHVESNSSDEVTAVQPIFEGPGWESTARVILARDKDRVEGDGSATTKQVEWSTPGEPGKRVNRLRRLLNGSN